MKNSKTLLLYFFNLKYIMFFLVIIFLNFVQPYQADDKLQELIVGKSVTQSWILGKVYKYQVNLPASQYVEISLQETKVNESLLESMKVFQNGKLVVDSENKISFTTEKDASYELQIKAKNELEQQETVKHSLGDYTVKLITSDLNAVKIEFPLLSNKSFQGYEAKFYGKEEKGAFELLKDNTRIYLQKGGRFWLGEEEFNDEKAKQTDLVDIGKDVTGDGQADLVIQEASNEDCCRSIYVYQLSKEFKHITTLYVGELAEVEFDDLDGDKLPEFIVTDDTFASWEIDKVDPPIPTVVLKFKDGVYQVAKEFMQNPSPSFLELKDEAEKVKDSGWDEDLLTEAPWAQMVELIYTGHSGLAWQFFELAWPTGIENGKVAKADFIREFQKQLTKSSYWPEIQSLNALVTPPIKAGYIDKTGQVVIEPKLEAIGQFDEELAPVLVDEKYGYIDKIGKIIIKPQFVHAGVFSEGLALVSVEVKDSVSYGYIDKTGQFVIKPQFADAKDFSESLAVVGSLVKNNLVYGYIDKTGKMVIKPQFAQADKFSDGLAAIGVETKDSISYGYIDKTGKAIVKPQYDEISNFSEGFALVGLEEDDELYNFGYIDKTGKIAIKLQYQEAEDFSEGLALVQIDGAYGYIDKSGKIVIQPQYLSAESFSEGLALVQIKSKYGYIDKTGKTVVTPQFIEAKSFSDGFAVVKINGKYGYIDKTGKEMIKAQFDEIGDFHQGLAFILKNGN